MQVRNPIVYRGKHMLQVLFYFWQTSEADRLEETAGTMQGGSTAWFIPSSRDQGCDERHSVSPHQAVCGQAAPLPQWSTSTARMNSRPACRPKLRGVPSANVRVTNTREVLNTLFTLSCTRHDVLA